MLKKQIHYHILLLPALLLTLIFQYVPMVGIIIAFKNFSFRKGIIRSDWVGLKNFIHFFEDMDLVPAVINTIGIGFLNILLAFPAAIAFALLLNEIRSNKLKRVVQTVSYLPHFISWVVVSVILITFLSPSEGVINNVLVSMNILKEPVLFIGKPKYFWVLTVFSNMWKETGWSAIIYLAAITGIDPSVYEAAIIDGSNRLQRMWYITLPSIKGTIAILLIFAISGIPFIAFDQSYMLGNPLNHERSIVLSHYVYKLGIENGQYSYSAAVGLILSTISAIFMIIANRISKKTSGTGVV